MVAVWSGIDWTQPWYGSVREAASQLGLPPGGEDCSIIAFLNARAGALGLCNRAGAALKFVPQSSLPEGSAYEAFIGATGSVPTRENLHDFFNALVWLSFPRIKQELNALQAAQIALAGIGKSRGPARDAATIFDENAALLVVRDAAEGLALVDALRRHDWPGALLERGALFGADANVHAADVHAELWLFGHALMEKLVAPYKAITAHTRVVLADAGFFSLDRSARQAWIDEQVAAKLAADGLSKADFTPVQVLGIPGWWPGQDAAFYADTTVFRPRREDSNQGKKQHG
jgi:hypothetical protein